MGCYAMGSRGSEVLINTREVLIDREVLIVHRRGPQMREDLSLDEIFCRA